MHAVGELTFLLARFILLFLYGVKLGCPTWGNYACIVELLSLILRLRCGGEVARKFRGHSPNPKSHGLLDW